VYGHTLAVLGLGPVGHGLPTRLSGLALKIAAYPAIHPLTLIPYPGKWGGGAK